MTDLLRPLYGDLAAFTTVVRRLSFKAASIELGVTPSAISHSIQRLEKRLNAKLIQRTSRTLAPTEEGRALAAKLTEGFQQIETAISGLHNRQGGVVGTLKLNIPHDASRLLITPVLPAFIAHNPEARIHLVVEDNPIDLIGEGFDAGIRYGGKVPESMVAVALTPPLRWVVVASPLYLRREGYPRRPSDLRRHTCIGTLLGDRSTYAWELGEGRSAVRLAMASKCLSSDTQTSIDAVLNGIGLAYVLERRVADEIADGRLQVILENWASQGPGMYMYYPNRNGRSRLLLQLIGLIRHKNLLPPIINS